MITTGSPRSLASLVCGVIFRFAEHIFDSNKEAPVSRIDTDKNRSPIRFYFFFLLLRGNNLENDRRLITIIAAVYLVYLPTCQ